MNRERLLLWIIFSSMVLGLSVLIGVSLLLGKFFRWMRFSWNLKSIKHDFVGKIAEQRSGSIQDMFPEADKAEVCDATKEEIANLQQDVRVSLNAHQASSSVTERVFYAPDDFEFQKKVQEIIDKKKFAQQDDIVSLKVDIERLYMSIGQQEKKFWEQDKKIWDQQKVFWQQVVRHLQQQHVHMKQSLTEYIDQKVAVQNEQSTRFDLRISALQEQVSSLVSASPTSIPYQSWDISWVHYQLDLQHRLLQQKINYSVVILVLCLLLTIGVLVLFLKYM